MKFKLSAVVAASLLATGMAHAATELVIATVNNGHMIEMQKLSKNFEQANPDIKLKWVTLEEGTLRSRVTTDIATKGGQFDVMTIGMYETPIWAKKGWLKELKPDAAYDIDDLLPVVAAKCRAFIGACKAHGIDVLITSTYRDRESQDALYAQGRTAPGPRNDSVGRTFTVRVATRS